MLIVTFSLHYIIAHYFYDDVVEYQVYTMEWIYLNLVLYVILSGRLVILNGYNY